MAVLFVGLVQYPLANRVLSTLEFGGCSSNVNLTGINGNVIMSGWKDDKPAMKEEKGLDIGIPRRVFRRPAEQQRQRRFLSRRNPIVGFKWQSKRRNGPRDNLTTGRPWLMDALIKSTLKPNL